MLKVARRDLMRIAAKYRGMGESPRTALKMAWKEMRNRELVNPGTNWHVDRASHLRSERARAARFGNDARWNELNERVIENEFAADASRKLGMNPIEKKFPILPLAVIGILGWLIYKNRQ